MNKYRDHSQGSVLLLNRLRGDEPRIQPGKATANLLNRLRGDEP